MSRHSFLCNNLTRIITCFLGFFLISASLWARNYFGSVTLDQTFSTLVFNMQQSLAADAVLRHRLLIWCLLWPSLLTFIVLNTHNYLYRRGLLSASGNTISDKLYQHIHTIILIAGMIVFCQEFQLVPYALQQLS